MNKEQQLKFHEMQANWWMHAASNGHCQSKLIYKGTGNKKFTKDELIDEAMKTSQKHIQLYMKVAENWKGE